MGGNGMGFQMMTGRGTVEPVASCWLGCGEGLDGWPVRIEVEGSRPTVGLLALVRGF
jgi:hypothetical protein